MVVSVMTSLKPRRFKKPTRFRKRERIPAKSNETFADAQLLPGNCRGFVMIGQLPTLAQRCLHFLKSHRFLLIPPTLEHKIHDIGDLNVI